MWVEGEVPGVAQGDVAVRFDIIARHDAERCTVLDALGLRRHDAVDGIGFGKSIERPGDPDEAWRLFIGWEKNADAMFRRRARVEANERATDQVVFISTSLSASVLTASNYSVPTCRLPCTR
jgi:hypothetical protein